MKSKEGTLLYVDLSSGKIEKQPLSEHLRLNYVGGRGINVRILFDEVGPGVNPLSPENVLIFGTGLFSGTSAPCPARFNVTSKAPLTGIIGDANAGGHFGPSLRRAGIDHIIIRGKADEPVYLWIDDGKVEIRSARHLWGKNTRETDTMIKDELGDKRVRVATMGQAGENLVRMANVVHEERSASRTGMGAVMGSKNLKAVAVRGTKEVKGLFDLEGFNRRAKELMKAISKSNDYDYFTKGSASVGVYMTNETGFLAVRNYQMAGGFEGIENFNPEDVVAKYYHGNVHCFGCPIGCGKNYKIKDGPYAGEWGVKIEEGAFSPLGPVCGNANIDSIFKMNNVGNQLGIDHIEFGQAMSVLMDCYEKGIVSSEDLDGISLTWGNYEAMLQMMEKVAFRQGIGDVLADGIVRASKKLGKEVEKYVSHSKGMVLAAIDPRMMKGTALGLATSTRGADHLRAMVIAELAPVMTPEEAQERFGTEDVLKATSYNKAAALVYYQHLYIVPDLFEVCRFLFGLGQGTESFSYKDLFELYSLATGIEVDEKYLFNICERIYNLERAFICREGIRRKDDHLIGKWAEGPVPSGPYKGEELDPRKWEEMLDEYYRLRGWDENGVPTKEKLKALELEDVAASLDKAGVYSKKS
jgi:aldehyde:ferredoxin oxidoreductase